jgi:hypothetical protein
MSFVRPEVAVRLRRWREPVLWAGLLVLGVWLLWRGYFGQDPLRFAVGLAFTIAGIGLLRSAIRRVRLNMAEPGEGVVLVDEARIGFFGPRDGGFVDLPALISVDIVLRRRGGHAWVLSSEDGTRLTIPLGARGAERLYDALSPLPGIDFDAAAAALNAPGPGARNIWHRTPAPERSRLR